MLAVTQRIGLATLTLEAGLGIYAADATTLGAFAEEFDARMAELAAALRESRRVVTKSG